MKDFFKRNGLFKIIGILFIITLLLTWMVPVGQVSGNAVESYGLYSLGIRDITYIGSYALSYALSLAVFLFVLASFYGVVSKTEGYKNLIVKATKLLKGKEIVFIIVVSALMAICASIFSTVEATLVFVPLIITIILGLKLDKLTAFVTTFGSALVGMMGYTFNQIGLGQFIGKMGLEHTDGILIRVGILVLGLILLNFFNVTHAKKVLKDKKFKGEQEADLFAVEIVEEKASKKNKKKVWPIVTILSVIAILVVLGFVPWSVIFPKFTLFNDMHTAIIDFTVGEEYHIFQNIIGRTAVAFGSWELLDISTVLLIACVILKFVYKIKFDDLLDDIQEGIKKIGKIFPVLAGAYLIIVVMQMTPVIPTILDWILKLTNNFNPFIASIGSALTSIFYFDLGFYGFSFGEYFAALYPDVPSLMLSLVTAMGGLVSFFAPTSLILLIGLKYLEIPYGTWMKYIWKFLVGTLICLFAIFALLTYI